MMRTILVVEDDRKKMELISNFLENFPVFINKAESFNDAQNKIMDNTYDLIILDMTLPNYCHNSAGKSGALHPLGGRELLEEINRYGIKTRVIIFTAYDHYGSGVNSLTLPKMTRDFEKKFSDIFAGTVFFDSFELDWTEKLLKIMQKEGTI